MGASPIGRLAFEQFGGNTAQTLEFLKTITPDELARAPREVQTEFVQIIKSLRESAVLDIEAFAKSTKDPKLAKRANRLTETEPEIATLTRKGTQEQLSTEEANRLSSLKTEREAILIEMAARLEPEKNASDAAKRRMQYRNRMVKGIPARVVSTERGDMETIRTYENHGALINQAIARLDMLDNFEAPILATSAVLSPETEIAAKVLGRTHPKAVEALKREAERQKTASGFHDGYRTFEERNIVPHLSDLPFKLSSISQLGTKPAVGFGRAKQIASERIVNARQSSNDPQEKEQLLDVLRRIDQERALKIEAKEQK